VQPRDLIPIFKVLTVAYPAWKPSPDTVDVWARLLADQDPRDIERAAVEHARTNEFPPTVANLIRLARPVADRPLTLEAWEEVIRWIPHGPNVRPTFSHPDIGRCVAMLGGYEVLCVDGLSSPSHRARFADAWESVTTRERSVESRQEAQDILGELGLRIGSGSGDGPRKLV